MSKDKNITGEVLGEVDPKLHIEAMIGEKWRMLRIKLEQVHEWMDRMENSRVEQPQSSNWRRREKVPPMEVRVEEKEYDGDKCDEEDERESVVNNKRYGGRFRELEIKKRILLPLGETQDEILGGLKIEKIIIWVALR